MIIKIPAPARYSDEEVTEMQRLYIEENKSVREVTKAVNDQFHGGSPVRTEKAVEHKLLKMKVHKHKNTASANSNLAPQEQKIIDLKKTMSYTGVAKKLNVPVGTVKNIISTYRKNGGVKDADKDTMVKGALFNTISRLEKELQKERSINSVILDTLKTSIARLPAVQVPNFIVRKSQYRPETAMLELGDMHYGEKIHKSDVANIGEYNARICAKRVDILRDSIHEIIDIQRSKIPIDTLDINALGDIVTGEDIYLGQARSIDLNLTEQTVEGAHMIAEKLLLPLCKLFKKVRFRGVYGNHGRPSKPGQFHPRTNFDYLLYMFLKVMLKNQTNLEFMISECNMMLYKLSEAPNYTHLISHGSEVNSWMGIPFYGIQRDHGKYMSLFDMPIHYMHMGHFHNAAKLDIPHGEQIVNGTFVGGSELSIVKMKTKSQPKQLFFGFNATRGITWRYDVILDKQIPLEIDEQGVYTPLYQER